MAGNIKINPEVAQGVAGSFTTNAGQLEGIIKALDQQVSNNVGSGKPGWEGKQADDFDNSWNTEFKPALNKLVEALHGANTLLTKTISAFQAIDG